MRLQQALAASSFLLTLGFGTPASAAAAWTPYISEESSPPFTWCSDTGQSVSGVRCSGSNCDNVSIRCHDMPFGVSNTSYYWSNWFSEENGNIVTTQSHTPPGWYPPDLRGDQHVCHHNGAAGVMTGFGCWGSYCDNIILQCAQPSMYVGSTLEPAELTDCAWSDYYSEEDPWFAYGVNSNLWISGVECANSYCDDKRYYVCEMNVAPNSCVGHCGGTSADLTCFCDSLCESWEDCCADFHAAGCG